MSNQPMQLLENESDHTHMVLEGKCIKCGDSMWDVIARNYERCLKALIEVTEKKEIR